MWPRVGLEGGWYRIADDWVTPEMTLLLRVVRIKASAVTALDNARAMDHRGHCTAVTSRCDGGSVR
jgi:hypothetical protein